MDFEHGIVLVLGEFRDGRIYLVDQSEQKGFAWCGSENKCKSRNEIKVHHFVTEALIGGGMDLMEGTDNRDD